MQHLLKTTENHTNKFMANAKIYGIPNRIYPFYETQCLSMTVSNVNRVSDVSAARVCNVQPQHVTSASLLPFLRSRITSSYSQLFRRC